MFLNMQQAGGSSRYGEVGESIIDVFPMLSYMIFGKLPAISFTFLSPRWVSTVILSGQQFCYSCNTKPISRTLIKEHPEKKYLKHVGFRRISIQRSRTAKNFTILKVEQESVMESTYREFVRSYEKARIYFVSTCYITQYRNVIPYYDNFIALCIFIMAIQQVSVRSIMDWHIFWNSVALTHLFTQVNKISIINISCTMIIRKKISIR